jgi:hypothetical protein
MGFQEERVAMYASAGNDSSNLAAMAACYL